MQPIKTLSNWMQKHANHEHYLFNNNDLRALFPGLSEQSFKTLLSRAADAQVIERVCRGLYIYKNAIPTHGYVLYHIAAYLRSNTFNYISLESALSDAGVISQIPLNYISIMSSGRSNIISCGRFGTIEFIHTTQRIADIIHQLVYDENCKLWRANVTLALTDMKSTHRNMDLIDWDAANEFIR